MTTEEIKIFCVYPSDKTTNFLDRIVSYLNSKFGKSFHCYKIKPNDHSHENCIRILNNLEGKIIVFLGHGRSDKLYGAVGNLSNAFGAENFKNIENSNFNEYYENLDFLNLENCQVFNRNIVFSLSCNSNEKKKSIGPTSVEKGALSFIGFGDIQTDYEEDKPMTLREISIFKGLIVKIIKNALVISIKNDYSIDKMVYLIKVLTSIERNNILLNCKGQKYRFRIAENLSMFKNEITIFGAKYLKPSHLFNSSQ